MGGGGRYVKRGEGVERGGEGEWGEGEGGHLLCLLSRDLHVFTFSFASLSSLLI